MNHNNLSVKEQSKFCELWPYAKDALDLIIAASPNWIVKTAISILVKVGDRLKEKICG